MSFFQKAEKFAAKLVVDLHELVEPTQQYIIANPWEKFSGYKTQESSLENTGPHEIKLFFVEDL